MLQERIKELEEESRGNQKALHESDEKFNHRDTTEERAAKELQAQLARKAMSMSSCLYRYTL
jgi:hypothetical protein